MGKGLVFCQVLQSGMATELEAKLAVASHEPIRAKLVALGATSLGMTEELNTFFDTPERKLFSSDQGLRIRRNRRASGEELVVTYKGPKQKGPFKNREEIEVGVDDHDNLVAMFGRLGYGVTLSFEKHRETWKLGTPYGEAEIVLDTLPPGLSQRTFMEVEAPNEDALRHVLGLLELSHTAPQTRSYAEMIHAYLKDNLVEGNTVRF